MDHQVLIEKKKKKKQAAISILGVLRKSSRRAFTDVLIRDDDLFGKNRNDNFENDLSIVRWAKSMDSACTIMQVHTV